MTGAPERIAVTGYGMVSALGVGAATTFDALVAGRVAFAPTDRLPGEGSSRSLVGRAPLEADAVIPVSDRARFTRSDLLALVAAREAWQSAGLSGTDGGASLVIGASTGGMLEAEQGALSVGPDEAGAALARAMIEAPVSQSAERVAEALGGARRKLTLCSACSSGAAAIALGAGWLENGRVERVLVGGVDSLCLLTLSGFNALGVIDPAGCRPFDAARAGLTLGEGAAFLVLERGSVARARAAPIRGWLTGWSLAAEAYHITQPEPSGATATRLMAAALARAGLEPGKIGYLNAHGTGTPHNDAMEAAAIRGLFGSATASLPISSVKGQLGHTLAAAGAIEAVVTVVALERGLLPPTGGLRVPDPALGALLHVVGRGRPAAIEAAMSSSYGFGGAGGVLVFERASAGARTAARPLARRTVVSGVAAWHGDARGLGEDVAAMLEEGGDTQLPSLEALDEDLDPDRSRRFDRLSGLAAAGAGLLLDRAGLSPAGTGLVVGLAAGAIERSARFVERVLTRGPRLASPAEFPQLILSAASGNVSVYHGLTGPVVTVSDRRSSAEDALSVGDTIVRAGLAPAVLVAALAVPDPLAKAAMAAAYPAAVGSVRRPAVTFLLLEAEGALAARGRRPMALLAAADTIERDRFRPAELPRPTKARFSLLVSVSALSEAPALEFGDWSAGRNCPLETAGGEGELGVGTALAVAAAMVASGDAGEVLVVQIGERWVHWSHLTEVPPGPGG